MSLTLFKRPELWIDPIESFNTLFRDPFVDYDSGLTLKSRAESTDVDYIFTLEVPGFSEDEISIEIKDKRLEIVAEHKQEADGKYFHQKVQRSWALPNNIKDDGVTASLKNGVLSVQVPKSEPALPKKIQVKALTS